MNIFQDKIIVILFDYLGNHIQIPVVLDQQVPDENCIVKVLYLCIYLGLLDDIEGVLVWITATEDTKNSLIRISIRSRGPVINKIAERYNGGGHKLASGARVPSYEEVDMLIKDLDKVCKKYIESGECDENY